MAEFNYKWVLKNAPGCGYADEAEFMMLHLGERTESAEELQAEAIRQGKNKKTSSADSTAVSIKSEQVKKTSFARLVVIPPSGGTNQGG
jgi:hypothetical protein